MAREQPEKNINCEKDVRVAMLSYTTMPDNVVNKNHADW
jgi:hypothetical protein